MIKRFSIVLALLLGLGLYAWHYQPNQATPTISRWQKLDSAGQPMGAWQGPWACILDKKTGLIWENKLDDESIYDGYWSYSWFDGTSGTPAGGDCFYIQGGCSTLDFIKRANQAKLCGLTDWRLPSNNELRTLLITPARLGQAFIDTSFFPHTQRGSYWTDEKAKLEGFFARFGEGAKAVNFKQGNTIALPKNSAAFVRLVHGVKG